MNNWSFIIVIPLITGALLGQTGFALAGQQYNAFENRYETAPGRYSIKYNAFENEWSYEAPEAALEYNAFEDRYEWNPEPAVIQPYPCEVESDLHHR